MKKLLISVCLTLLAGIQATAALTEGKEYYIWLNIYEKLLGSNEAGNGPALSAYGTKSDGYVFVAENSGKDGYVLLRQKSSGKYLAASGSNGWSVLLESSKSTDDRFCWKADEGVYTYIINKKSGKYLGIDGAQKGNAYVSVFYDKPKGSHSQYSIIPATGNWDEARQAYESGVYTNAQSVKEIDYCQLNNKTISRSDDVDIHISANDNPIMGSSKVNLGSDRTWLIIDNIVPSKVISDYLKFVTINGATAQNGTNCRVAIYLNGAAVIPTPTTVMRCEGTDGAFTLSVGNNSDLGAKNNTMKSFTLRRGYMATVASGTNGSGHSRVYVADHADLTVTLPEALSLRVSSVNIKNWQYLSKKGWGSTAGTSGGPGLRATWYWSWNAAYWSTSDMEYVPCRQHRYWPSVSEVNSHASSATLSINEPEHSEQHEKSDCDCKGEWKNCTFMPDYLPSGARIGSAQPTDLTWLKTFFGHVDDMAYRCDFAVTHAYWDLGGRNETNYADWFCNTQCKSIWNNTKRPVWLTEMEVSASWNTNKIGSYEDNRKYLQVLLQKIDECPWIERYAIYATDMWQTYMYYEANPSKGLTPAGQVYRDHRATFAYNADYTKEPIWWRPGLKEDITLQYSATADDLFLLINNPNGDVTEKIVIERKPQGGSWQTLGTITKRSELDPTTVSYPLPLDKINRIGDTFRVTVTTMFGGTATSEEMTIGDYISNGSIVTESKDNVPGWTCQRSADNGYTKAASGDTYLEVWNSTAKDMAFDYYQMVGALPKGVYKLSAVCFNSSDKESGASANGNVGLYAQADGVEYFTPVTKDSEIDYKTKTVIPQILVRDGMMRIGIKNQGPMTARWAGADDFVLEYLGTEEEVLAQSGDSFIKIKQLERDKQLNVLFADLPEGRKDASVLIRNTDCNRNDNYGWTVSNLETKKGQAWDGDANNNYWDKWNSGSLKSSMEQTIDYLPAGEYEVSALLRCSSGQTITLSATHNGQAYTKKLTGTGDQTQSNSDYKNGWNELTLPTFIAASGDQLTIKASISTQVTTWWSADHFTLTWKKDNTTVGISSTENVSPTKSIIYDLQGRRLNAPVKNGIYIRNGKKYIK